VYEVVGIGGQGGGGGGSQAGASRMQIGVALHRQMYPGRARGGEGGEAGRRSCLLDGLGNGVKVKPLDHAGASDHGGKGRLVLLLVGEGQGPHGAPVEGTGEGDDLVGGSRIGVVRVNPGCKNSNVDQKRCTK